MVKDSSGLEERIAEALADQKSRLMSEHLENISLQQAEFDIMAESLRQRLEESEAKAEKAAKAAKAAAAAAAAAESARDASAASTKGVMKDRTSCLCCSR